METRKGKRLLVIGGSGFVSGAVARAGQATGCEVSIVTRGVRPVPDGVTKVTVDRKDRAVFRKALSEVSGRFDLVADCICYDADDAQQDVEVFANRCDRLVFISTDSVYEPSARTVPQDERVAVYCRDGYGGRKRDAEDVFVAAGTEGLPWTILRPCHIYGPGSLLGCLPKHARDAELVDRIMRGETLELAGGGHSLQQPLFVEDLAATIVACGENDGSIGAILNIAGPSTIECRQYYRIVADALGVPLKVKEAPYDELWSAAPDLRSFLVHRVVTQERLRATGLPLPATTPEIGLPLHVRTVTKPRPDGKTDAGVRAATNGGTKKREGRPR